MGGFCWSSTPLPSAHPHATARSASESLDLTLDHLSLESTPNKVWTNILVKKRLAGEDVTNRTNTPSLQQCHDHMHAARAREFESVESIDCLREIGVQFRLHIDHAFNDQSRFLLMLFTDYMLGLLERLETLSHS